MRGRELATVPFSTEALKANLLRLQNEWETVQASRDRDAIYQYLNSIFELVSWWDEEGKAVKRACRAMHLRGYSSVREPEPFAAVILCTADHAKVDERTRSKWSRVLRYAAEYKDLDELLRDFIVRRGGLNECAERYARALGDTDNHRDPLSVVMSALLNIPIASDCSQIYPSPICKTDLVKYRVDALVLRASRNWKTIGVRY